jgi:hypothetical protein
MMLNRTASLAFAAACLTAIATVPAYAQMAGTYGSTRPITPRRPTKATWDNRRRRAEMLSRAINTIGPLKQIARSARRVCARSAVRFRIPNSVKAALRASINPAGPADKLP